MKNELYDCAWVLRNLWKRNTLFSTNLPIPNTLLIERGAVDYTWLYTSKRGVVRRKSAEKCQIPSILGNFFKETSAFLVEKNQFFQITKQPAINKVVEMSLDDHSALVSVSSTKRLYVTYSENTPHRFMQDYKTSRTSLQSQYFKDRLSVLSKQVVNVLENSTTNILSV